MLGHQRPGVSVVMLNSRQRNTRSVRDALRDLRGCKLRVEITGEQVRFEADEPFKVRNGVLKKLRGLHSFCIANVLS